MFSAVKSDDQNSERIIQHVADGILRSNAKTVYGASSPRRICPKAFTDKFDRMSGLNSRYVLAGMQASLDLLTHLVGLRKCDHAG